MQGIDITAILRLRDLAERLDSYGFGIGKRTMHGCVAELLAEHMREEANRIEATLGISQAHLVSHRVM